MSNFRGTPGPWIATCVRDENGPAFWLIDACPTPNQETAVAELCVKPGDRAEANARLIAEAPALLNALEAAYEAIDSALAIIPTQRNPSTDAQRLFNLIHGLLTIECRTAIAKATEPPTPTDEDE